MRTQLAELDEFDRQMVENALKLIAVAAIGEANPEIVSVEVRLDAIESQTRVIRQVLESQTRMIGQVPESPE